MMENVYIKQSDLIKRVSKKSLSKPDIFIIKHLDGDEFTEKNEFYNLVIIDYNNTNYEVMKYIDKNGKTIIPQFKNQKMLIKKSIVSLLMLCGL